MKLAVFSDMHGNLTAFDAMLQDLASVGEVDMVWCLGDIAALGARPSECIQRIKQRGKDKFKVIGGNTDRYLVTGERFKLLPIKEEADFGLAKQARLAMNAMLDWGLQQLSWEDYQFLSQILHRETGLKANDYGHIIGYHAIPGDDESFALRPDTPNEEAHDALLDREGSLAIGGHTHLQMDRDLDNWRVLNVGSVGLSFDMPGKAQWGLVTVEDGVLAVDLRAVPYDVEQAKADLKAVDFPVPEWVEKKWAVNA